MVRKKKIVWIGLLRVQKIKNSGRHHHTLHSKLKDQFVCGMRPFAKFSDMYQKIFYIHKKLCVTVCGFTFSGMSSSSLLYPSSISQEIETKRKQSSSMKGLGILHFSSYTYLFFSSSSSTNGEKWYKCFFFSSVIIIHSDVIFML